MALGPESVGEDRREKHRATVARCEAAIDAKIKATDRINHTLNINASDIEGLTLEMWMSELAPRYRDAGWKKTDYDHVYASPINYELYIRIGIYG